MDAIALLKSDHQSVERLFRRFEQAGPRARVTKVETVQRIVHELAVHSALEEHVFYPAVLDALPDARNYVLESLEEHDVAAWLSIGLEGLGADEERYDAKAAVLIAEVRYHVGEEETMLFPEVRAALGRTAPRTTCRGMCRSSAVTPRAARIYGPPAPPRPASSPAWSPVRSTGPATPGAGPWRRRATSPPDGRLLMAVAVCPTSGACQLDVVPDVVGEDRS